MFSLKRVGSAAVVAVAIAAITSSRASANLITDGDFSSPYGGATFTTYGPGGSMGPWTVTGTVDLIGGYWQAPPTSVGSVDLDGLSVGGISQTFATTTGQNYLLTFYLSGNPDGIGTLPTNAPDPKLLGVVVDMNNSANYTFITNLGGQSHNMMNYVFESLIFTADSTSTTLKFSSDDVLGNFGPVIGGVSVTATPLPAAISMFVGGLGLIGLVSRRRNKKRATTAQA